MNVQQTTAALDECIALNEAAQVDRIARWHLDSLSDQLRKYRCNISKLPPEGAAIYVGPNMRGPAIADLIRQSEQHRRIGALDRRAAA